MNSKTEPLFRPTWATIDLDALVHNFGVIAKRLPPGVGIMAMVKADAYGHGATPVCRALEDCGVRALGVATLEEGVELRQAGIKTPILVMEGLMGAGAPASELIVETDLTPVIHSSSVLESLESVAARAGRTIGVHLKVDTGMSRLGARPESLPPLLNKLASCPHLSVEGVMTHLSDAGEESFSAEQMDVFLSCRQAIDEALGKVRVWHVANSLAILRGQCVDIPGVKEAWVRPGLALYGECNGNFGW
jgi:alanine racemase